MCTSSPYLPFGVAPYGPYQNRRSITERIPEEIISLICNETENSADTSHGPFAQKYTKNINVLTFSQVCRTWRSHINSNASLWKDVTFDVCDARSVRMAHHSLSVMERTDTLFAVYARLYGDLRPAVEVLIRLRPLIGRIMHLEYLGELGECGRYLDLPAENLRHLSGSLDLDPSAPRILSTPLFAGQMPCLRSIAMASATHCMGWVVPLPTLTDLELVPPHLGHLVSLISLFNLLDGLPALRNLKLSGFGLIDDDNHTSLCATLPHLEILDLNQSDIQTIVNHLCMPNIRKITFYGSSYPPGYSALSPVFRAPHFFARLSVPLLEQEIEEVFVMAGVGGFDKRFWIRLVASNGCSLDVRMCWPRTMSQGWEGYVEHSIIALGRHVLLSPGAQASLDFQVPFTRPFFTPFLHSPHIHRLTINCGSAEEFFSSLATVSTPLPQLKTLEIVDLAPTWDRVPQALNSYLRARGIVLAVRDTRGPFPPLDTFDIPDTGYIMTFTSLLADALSEMQF